MEMFSKSCRDYNEEEDDDEEALKWASLERLPTYLRLRTAVITDEEEGHFRQVDLKHLGADQRKNVLEKLVKVPEKDYEDFLWKLKDRVSRY